MTAPVRDLQAALAVTRFGLGARPGELDGVRSDPRGRLAAQVRPAGADQPDAPPPDSRASLAVLRGYRVDVRDAKIAAASAPTTGADAAAELRARRMAGLTPLKAQVGAEVLARTRLAVTTQASFRERWALFWSNRFTVSAAKLKSSVLAGPFEREAIRPHVFGRFEDLLVASTTHPGVLLYLDQETSIGPESPAARFKRGAGLNENLAREVMELHTVGADAGYTQADVIEFARALTGYTIADGAAPVEQQGRFTFNPALHEPGPRRMGLGPDWSRTVVVAVTEFGRTARVNGTHGTDHGAASTLIWQAAR